MITISNREETGRRTWKTEKSLKRVDIIRKEGDEREKTRKGWHAGKAFLFPAFQMGQTLTWTLIGSLLFGGKRRNCKGEAH